MRFLFERVGYLGVGFSGQHCTYGVGSLGIKLSVVEQSEDLRIVPSLHVVMSVILPEHVRLQQTHVC